jgi:hypothetical protein
LKNPDKKPSLFIKKGRDLNLSSEDLVILMKEVLSRDSCFRFRARGFSMFPFIRDNDIVTVAPLKGAFPAYGDVVAFLHPELKKLTVHRVVKRKGRLYAIKGDNLELADGLVPLDSILGTVIKVERKGRRVFSVTGPVKHLIAVMSQINLIRRVFLPAARFVYRAFRGKRNA